MPRSAPDTPDTPDAPSGDDSPEGSPEPRTRRPRAWERHRIPWHLGLVPRTWTFEGQSETHPARRCAVFVVHGMGRQERTQTAGVLRSGFEDVLEDIFAWQREHLAPEDRAQLPEELPPPFLFEGYWGNYTDLEQTYPEEWARFNAQERRFFHDLWHRRAASALRTGRWILFHQLRLLHPRVIRDLGLLAWILYVPLQVVSAFSLGMSLWRRRELITDVVADVRLYCTPEGGIEREMGRRIDERVGAAFLRLIGLDWSFRPLPYEPKDPERPETGMLTLAGDPIHFERVVWVAHSLGTVISYNVLSDLFHRAEELEEAGDDEQREGVRRFRRALRRFVTLGSPLDKIAYLFGERALRPWPQGDRRELLRGGEGSDSGDDEWWVNFYHVADPVSGGLESPLICDDQPPRNLHLRSLASLPGLAHLAYWCDSECLRFILGRSYGPRYLRDQEFDPWPAWLKLPLTLTAYVVWAVLLVGGAGGLVVLVWFYGPDLLRAILSGIKGYLLGL